MTENNQKVSRKLCFKCKVEKPISDFYVHPMMKDGHLGKCKDCTKKDTLDRTANLLKNPEWVEKERARHREKFHRLHKNWKQPNKEAVAIASKKHKKAYPEKYRAVTRTSRMHRTPGQHLHHWSYLPEHWKDVIGMSVVYHNLIHRFMVYDQERAMYRKLTGELIDSRLSAINYYNEIIQREERQN